MVLCNIKGFMQSIVGQLKLHESLQYNIVQYNKIINFRDLYKQLRIIIVIISHIKHDDW